MSPELTGSRGGLGARVPRETRASRDSQAPPERREKPGTRGAPGQTEPLERGVGLGSEAPGGRPECEAPEETREKMDHKVTRAGKDRLESLETRARPGPLGRKATEATRVPLGLRVPEEPQARQALPETPG